MQIVRVECVLWLKHDSATAHCGVNHGFATVSI